MPAHARRCQLTGCDQTVESLPNEPTQRKFCCPEHRIAARRLRHEILAGHTPSGTAFNTPTIIAENPAHNSGVPGTGAAPTESRRLAAPAGVAALRQRLASGKARTAIGATALALGATAVAVLLSGPGAGQTTLAQIPLPAPHLPAGLDTWRAAAQADLQATRLQLAEADRGVGAWDSVPQTGRTTAVAGDYTQLQAAEGNLRAQQDLLTNDLAAADRDRSTAAQLTTALARLAATRNAADPTGDDAVRADCLRLERDFTTLNNQVRVFTGRSLPDPGDISTANLADVIVQAGMTRTPGGPNGGTASTGSPPRAVPVDAVPSWPGQINQVTPFIDRLLGH